MNFKHEKGAGDRSRGGPEKPAPKCPKTHKAGFPYKYLDKGRVKTAFHLPYCSNYGCFLETARSWKDVTCKICLRKRPV